MKRFALALALWLWPALAAAQCTGVFPAQTLCGNLSGSPNVPSAFPASGTVIGPVSSTLNGLPLWANTAGTQLKDGAGLTVAGTYTWGGAQTYSATNTFNALANFTSTFQIAGNTITWPASAGTVPFLALNQTWTGNNTFNTGTNNFVGPFQINGTTVTLPLSVPNGGIGSGSLTSTGVVLGRGTGPLVTASNGTIGQVLTSNGAGVDPSFQFTGATTANPANPTGVSSTAMLGLGSSCTITPALTGRVKLTITGSTTSTSPANNVITLRSGTGTAPANGAAVTGTSRSSIQSTMNSSTWFTPFTLIAIFSGNSLGVAIWFDLAVAPQAGTGSAVNLTCIAEET